MNYEDWPLKPVSISRLKLDPENPRLTSSLARPTQPELIAELLAHEDVMDLVRDIAKLGYFPNEPLVATVESSNTIVLEGNRRLAALKLLANPDLAPQEFKKRIQQLAAHARVPDKVYVVMAPSRDAAIPLIVARHKGKPVAEWRTIQQVRFIESRLRRGLTIDQVALETNLERSEVVKAVRDAKLYDVVLSLPLPAEVMEVAADPRKFHFSTLRRLIDNSKVRERLGVLPHETKGFSTTIGEEPFKAALGRIVTDIAKEEITSRSLNEEKQIETYLKELDDGPASATGQEPVSADAMIDPAKARPAPKRRQAHARAQTPTPRTLIPRGFRVDVDNDRTREVCDELKRLRLEPFRNSVAVTFRTLIEMAVIRYLQQGGHLKKLRAEIAQRQKIGADWCPSLEQLLNYVLQTPAIPLAPDARRALQGFLSDKSSAYTLDAMHAFTHNRFTSPTPDDLRKFFQMLRPLLELTLQNDPDEEQGREKKKKT